MTTDQLIEAILDKKELSAETEIEIKAYLKQFPYFTPARIRLIANKNLSEDLSLLQSELRTHLPYINCRESLFYVLKNEGLGWNKWYNHTIEKYECVKKEEKDNMISLIDDFLCSTTLPIDRSITNEETLLLPAIEVKEKVAIPHEEVQPEVTNDFSRPARKSLQETFSRLKRKAGSEPKPTIVEETLPSTTSFSDDSLSESLAKIYIKQRKFEKALAIFQALKLKYPNKSVYFAEQIRFLEIVINNIKKN